MKNLSVFLYNAKSEAHPKVFADRNKPDRTAKF